MNNTGCICSQLNDPAPLFFQLLIVCHHNDRLALIGVEGFEDPHYLLGIGFVEGTCWLVGKDKIAFLHHESCKCDALLLTDRKYC